MLRCCIGSTSAGEAMQDDTTFTANFIKHSGYLTQVTAKCKIRQSTQMKSATFFLADLPILCLQQNNNSEVQTYGINQIWWHRNPRTYQA